MLPANASCEGGSVEAVSAALRASEVLLNARFVLSGLDLTDEQMQVVPEPTEEDHRRYQA